MKISRLFTKRLHAHRVRFGNSQSSAIFQTNNAIVSSSRSSGIITLSGPAWSHSTTNTYTITVNNDHVKSDSVILLTPKVLTILNTSDQFPVSVSILTRNSKSFTINYDIVGSPGEVSGYNPTEIHYLIC